MCCLLLLYFLKNRFITALFDLLNKFVSPLFEQIDFSAFWLSQLTICSLLCFRRICQSGKQAYVKNLLKKSTKPPFLSIYIGKLMLHC
jgi:hypothetical protein